MANEKFVQQLERDLSSGIQHNKRSVDKIASSYGISDNTLVKELTELAIVNVARTIARGPGSVHDRFRQIVELYQVQPNLSHRTSQSISLQQYSTPAPICFLAGIFCGIDKLDAVGGYAFEPTAGNGLMTIAARPDRVYVNELDEVRLANLRTQGFVKVWDRDASKDFSDVHKTFSAILANPPFGSLDPGVDFKGYEINSLEQLIAIRALDTMKDDGKAAIIIGGHTQWDAKGRVQAGKNRIFLNYLNHFYHVKDVINNDGSFFARQGTRFPTRLILIAGRKQHPEGVAPLFSPVRDKTVTTFEELYSRVTQYITISDMRSKIEIQAEQLSRELENLGAPYISASEGCFNLNVHVPDAMEYETQQALAKIKRDTGGDLVEYVRKKLNYKKREDLCKALASEQIDAVAMAIYNIEFRKQAMIIGDQTGIGKGRIAAAMIRYGMENDIVPIFFTEKPNLFSDIYRDLNEIGSDELAPIRLLERIEKREVIDEETGAKTIEDVPVYSKRELRVPAGTKQVVPFIVNGRSAKTEIKDQQGNLVYQGLQKTELDGILKTGKLPKRFNLVLTTYSQFNSPERKPLKPSFILKVAKGNIIIMDESHNASGYSQTGEFLSDVVRDTKGAVFLSATFAKRPDNMPIYAMKTAISDANLTAEELINAIMRGGVALQEILSSQLVREGQMLRRERTFEGIEVNYISLDAQEKEHRRIADTVTEIIRDIIFYQSEHIKPFIEQLDKKMAAEQKEATMRQGTEEAGINNQPYFSKVFNVINQMLFSIKADSVADRAIQRLREGKKPIIAFSSTMESFLDEMQIEGGGTINADFSEVLKRGIDGVLRYSVIDEQGNQAHAKIQLSEMPIEARADYKKIMDKIRAVSTGISISPIDIIVQKIRAAGYNVAEVTGRKSEVQINTKTMKGIILPRKKVLVNDAFRMFNDNEVDVLLINQSGSTGASAHAIPTKKVPAAQVKQRVMIILQAELDINREVQKRGRINRTGQIKKPIYDYINSSIPAEKRLMMMLQKKLKSLDANTTSNQKNSDSILSVADFLNKYGDKVVAEYLKENPAVNKLLDDPLRLNTSSADSKDDFTPPENAAHKVSGRVAVLSTHMQENFYREINDRYNDLVEYLKQTGEYDLEVEAMNLEAETVNSKVVKAGKGGRSSFGDDSLLETVKVNVLKKPMKQSEIKKLISESLGNKDPETYTEDIKSAYFAFEQARLSADVSDSNEKFARLIKEAKSVEDRDKLETQRDEAAGVIRQHSENRQRSITDILDYFRVGMGYNYPVASYGEGNMASKAVFLGFDIDKKRPNPFAPSAIKIRLAIADSNRYIALPASYYEKIMAIRGETGRMSSYEQDSILDQWDEIAKKATVNRAQRFIITGNILQAFSDHKGKLISYTTTKPGETKKGILLPDNWDPSKQLKGKVTVPIIQALKILKSMQSGSVMTFSSDIYMMRINDDQYFVFVPLSKQQGGDFYLNEDILALTEGRIFEKSYDRYAGGHKMRAQVSFKKLPDLVRIMQDKFNLSATIAETQFELLDRPKRKTEPDIVLPPVVEERKADAFEIEALALELELELLTI